MLKLKRYLFTAAVFGLLINSTFANAEQPEYLEVKQDNLWYLDTEHGTVIIQLADFFAPNHVNRLKTLTRLGAYDGASFNRVIENFVVQGGPSDKILEYLSNQANYKSEFGFLQPEFERAYLKSSRFLVIQQPEYFAEQTGFLNGFPAGRSSSDKKEWLIHCPGAVNFTRSNDPASAQSNIAIMLGVPARHLDRNMTIVGRVVDGWPTVYQVKRGPKATYGVFTEPKDASKIVRAYLGSSLSKSQQQKVLIQNPESEAFQNRLAQHRLRNDEFFVHPNNGNLDICYQRQDVVIESPDN